MLSLFDTLAPSELVMRILSTSIAAASHCLAISTASSTLIFQGWYKSKSNNSVAIKLASAKPQNSSLAVYLAILHAASTASLRAVALKSDVLAWPFCWPK